MGPCYIVLHQKWDAVKMCLWDFPAIEGVKYVNKYSRSKKCCLDNQYCLMALESRKEAGSEKVGMALTQLPWFHHSGVCAAAPLLQSRNTASHTVFKKITACPCMHSRHQPFLSNDFSIKQSLRLHVVEVLLLTMDPSINNGPFINGVTNQDVFWGGGGICSAH